MNNWIWILLLLCWCGGGNSCRCNSCRCNSCGNPSCGCDKPKPICPGRPEGGCQSGGCMPLNPSARHHLLRDLPARHSMTVGDSFPYDKNRGYSILCPGSFSFYTKIQEDRCAKHHRITVPDQSCRSQQTGSHIRPEWRHP